MKEEGDAARQGEGGVRISVGSNLALCGIQTGWAAEGETDLKSADWCLGVLTPRP